MCALGGSKLFMSSSGCWGVHSPSSWVFFHRHLRGCLPHPHSTLLNLLVPKSWLSLSNVSLLQLVYILSFALAFFSLFSFFLSIAYPPSLAAYQYCYHLVVIHTSHQHWEVLCFRDQSLSQEAACQGLSPSSTRHQSWDFGQITYLSLLPFPYLWNGNDGIVSTSQSCCED